MLVNLNHLQCVFGMCSTNFELTEIMPDYSNPKIYFTLSVTMIINSQSSFQLSVESNFICDCFGFALLCFVAPATCICFEF